MNDTKLTLLTGATKGIGRAIAETLDSLNFKMILCARSISDLNELASSLSNQHILLATDLATKEGHGKLYELCESVGYPSIVIANMNPTPPYKLLINQTPGEITSNMSGSIDYILPIFKKSILKQQKDGFGRWIGISSIVASVGGIGQCTYIIQKKVLEGFFLSVATEYSGTGITSNILSLGLIDTEKTRSNKHFEKLSKMNILGRAGQPQEVSHMVACLVDPKSEFINGANLPINGGANLAWFLKSI